MTPVRLEPAALRSRVKHITTEPLRSRITGIQRAGMSIEKVLPVSVVISDIFCRGTGTGQSLEHSDKEVIE